MQAPDGFEAFVAARGDALHRMAYHLTRDHALAEDLVQTALAKAWPAWRRIEGEPEPYVRKIMVNTYCLLVAAQVARRATDGAAPGDLGRDDGPSPGQ